MTHPRDRALKALFFVLGIASLVLAQPDSSATSVSRAELEALRRKIDSLEARVELAQIQRIESDGLASGAQRQWGEGITIEATLSQSRLAAEFGYTFKTLRSWRLGILGEVEGGRVPGYTFLPTLGLYGKMSCGTPVFLNFMSLSGYWNTGLYTMLVQRPTHMVTALVGGVGAGGELEFWLKPNLCYTFGGSVTMVTLSSPAYGYNSETQQFTERTDDFGNERVVRTEVKFLGFKYYINRPKRR